MTRPTRGNAQPVTAARTPADPVAGATDWIDARERAWLAPYAQFSRDSAGREYAEPVHPYRGPYQRDRDRILHSSAFRRLSGKTQVFTGNLGDYHRTRLTHTMEVSSIARTLSRALRLNEDLTEALALLHDIGHPPFGHAGEDVLDACLADEGGFSHNRFALTLVRELERPYSDFSGLNLTREVLQSQETRVDKQDTTRPRLLEARVVDIADSITYDAHDVDDAVQLGFLTIEQLLELPLVAICFRRVVQRQPPLAAFARPAADGQEPGRKTLRRALVHELIDSQVSDLLANTQQRLQEAALQSANQASRMSGLLVVSTELQQQKRELERFLYQRVYRHPRVVEGRQRVQQRLKELFDYFVEHFSELPAWYQERGEQVGRKRAVGDYLAGMTDRFCLSQFERLLSGSPN